MAASNQFDTLNHGIDGVFKDLDPYLGIPELGSTIDTFKLCLTNNDTVETRLHALRAEIYHDTLISRSRVRYDHLYSIIRTSMIKYGINCTTNPPNGMPVWKKVVQVIWPEQYDYICRAREGSKSGSIKQPPLPPKIPPLPEATDDIVWNIRWW